MIDLTIGYGHKNRPVLWEDPFTHLFMSGKSGTGKTVLLKNWWQECSYFKSSKILVEPSGFMAKDCRNLSPRALYCSLDNPISLNPMAQPYGVNQKIDTLCEAINQVIEASGGGTGDLTVHMRSAIAPAVTQCVAKSRLTIDAVLTEIKKAQMNELTRRGIVARLEFLLEDERFNRILCGENPIEWGEFIEESKSLIFDASGMSKDKMVMAGTLIAMGIKNYFRYLKPKRYRPVRLFFDECHNFLNPNFFDLLKEGRKYKISCIMATQDFSMISDTLVKVLLNVGTIVSFRVGYEVASKIAREMRLRPEDLQNLPDYHLAYMTPRGTGRAKAPSPPFIRRRKWKAELRMAKPEKTEIRKNASGGWFPLEPYPAV